MSTLQKLSLSDSIRETKKKFNYVSQKQTIAFSEALIGSIKYNCKREIFLVCFKMSVMHKLLLIRK